MVGDSVVASGLAVIHAIHNETTSAKQDVVEARHLLVRTEVNRLESSHAMNHFPSSRLL